MSAVESILTLDRLRQNVAVKELETAHGQPLSMRKTVSVPNFSQVSRTSCTRSNKRIECFYIKITMLCPVPYFLTNNQNNNLYISNIFELFSLFSTNLFFYSQNSILYYQLDKNINVFRLLKTQLTLLVV